LRGEVALRGRVASASWTEVRSSHVRDLRRRTWLAVDVRRRVARLPQGHAVELGRAGGRQAEVAGPTAEPAHASRLVNAVAVRTRHGRVAAAQERRPGAVALQQDAVADGERIVAATADGRRGVEHQTRDAAVQ